MGHATKKKKKKKNKKKKYWKRCFSVDNTIIIIANQNKCTYIQCLCKCMKKKIIYINLWHNLRGTRMKTFAFLFG